MQFEGWTNPRPFVFTKPLTNGGTAIVCRPDGQTWGWMATDKDGNVLAGRYSWNFATDDAIRAAEVGIGLLAFGATA